MRSFVDIDRTFAGQPRELGAILARVDTGRGQEQLVLNQRRELLRRLSQHARIASITASNAPGSGNSATVGWLIPAEFTPSMPRSVPRERPQNVRDCRRVGVQTWSLAGWGAPSLRGD